MYFNARSLFPKLDDLRLICSAYSPDIVCIVETWLDGVISDSEISVQGYTIVRLDRTRHGGGLLIYVNNSFIFSTLYLGTAAFECIILSIICSSNNRNSPDFTIAVYYRPPNSTVSHLDTLFTTLCNLDVSLFSNFVLLGDFNINYFCTQTSLFSKLLSVTSSFNLSQVVSEPTRVFNNSCTLIDLVFVSSISQVLSCTTIPSLSNSDHYGLQLMLSLKAPKKQTKSLVRKVWSYSHANHTAISDSLNDVDWDQLLTDNVDSSWASWKSYFMDIMINCIPHFNAKPKYQLPWINKTIIQAMRRRKSLFYAAKRTGKSSDLEGYHRQRNRVVLLLRKSKQKFFDDLNAADSKGFWKSIKMLNSNQASLPATLSDDTTTADTSSSKATLLNNFFHECFNRKCPPLRSTTAHKSDSLNPALFPAQYLCSTEEVADLITKLDVSKSSGPDDISPRMLKLAAFDIAPSLTKIFNLSLTTGVFPADWKLAHVVPIPKNECQKHSVTGYRPISILPTVSKLLERHVSDIILEHISTNSPISNHQWGFMHHRSSTGALISVVHDWLQALNDGHEICVIFFDVKKAFDSVPHIPLLQKLADLNIDPYILKWIQDYLTERRQYVAVEGSSSPILNVLSGVPQGSVLGPLLFIIYLNDVVHRISNCSKINLYADDIALYRVISHRQDYSALQADIDAISDCLSEKYLTLNSSKCCYLLISRKRIHTLHPPSLILNGQQLTRVTSYKYLGVTITSDLMWSTHIANLCNKTRKIIGLFYRTFYKDSSPETMLKLYTSFIRPHLEYAAAVWDPFLKKDIDLLENTQKFALKVSTKCWNISYDDLLSRSNLPSLQDRRRQFKLCQAFNIIHELAYFPDAPFENRHSKYNSRTVHSKALMPIQTHTSQFQHSFFPDVIEQWNSLSESTTSATSIVSFKHNLRST